MESTLVLKENHTSRAGRAFQNSLMYGQTKGFNKDTCLSHHPWVKYQFLLQNLGSLLCLTHQLQSAETRKSSKHFNKPCKKYPVKYNYCVPNGRDNGNTVDIFKPKTIISRKIQTYFNSTFVVVSDTLNREFKTARHDGNGNKNAAKQKV